MANVQLYLAIGIPMAFNALLLLILRESLRDVMKDRLPAQSLSGLIFGRRVTQALLPAALTLPSAQASYAGPSRLKAGCGQNCAPHKQAHPDKAWMPAPQGALSTHGPA